MIKFDILHRRSGGVLYTAEIDCDEFASAGVKKGLAVRHALDNCTDLNGADLIKADLSNTDLRDVNFRDANLMGADLSNTDLRGADFRGANFRWTRLERSNIGDTKGIKAYATFGPIGLGRRYGHVILNDDFDPIVYLGCNAWTPKEAYRAIKQKYGKKSTYAAFVRAAVNELVERNPKPENV